MGKDRVIVVKMNVDREEVWRYEGRVLKRSPHHLMIEAFFDIDAVSFQGGTLKRRDRSIECFYDDRWYNLLEIHDREDDHLKFWYCNVTLPAEFTPGKIAYVDLALDIIIFPSGEYRILDEDEFEDLTLDIGTKQQALNSLEVLVEMAQSAAISNCFK